MANETNEQPDPIFGLRLREAIYKGICILSPEGWFGLANVNSFVKLFNKRLDQGIRLFVIDCTKTTHLDSSSVGALVSAFTRSRMRTGKFIIVPAPKVRQVLINTRLESVFEYFGSVPDAVSSLLGEPVESIPDLRQFQKQADWSEPENENLVSKHKDSIDAGVAQPARPEIAQAQASRTEPASDSTRIPSTDSSFTFFILSVFGALVLFGGTIIGLVWAARELSSLQASSLLVLTLILAVAIIFNVNAIVFILILSGRMSEKTAARLLEGALGKVPGLKAWIPKVLAQRTLL